MLLLIWIFQELNLQINFIEYEKLSRDQISTWAINKVGEDQINALKNGLTSELKDKAVEDPDNPVLTNIQLPN